jgi:hypothetical protein
MLAQQTLDQQKTAAAAQLDAANKAAAGQQSQLQAQIDAANKLYQSQSEATNRANQKQPDTATINANNQQQGKGGQSGTLLTGPAGVDLSKLKLGQATLLGQ